MSPARIYAVIIGCLLHAHIALGDDATPTPTAAPVRPGIQGGTVAGARGQQVSLAVTLRAGGLPVDGTSNDIGVDGVNFSFAALPHGKPDCVVNPSINAQTVLFTFRPLCNFASGCIIRAVVQATAPIPDGSVLYTCTVNISRTATVGTYPLPVSNVILVDHQGYQIPGTVGINGSLVVTDSPPVTLTPTMPPTITPTPTVKPTLIPTPPPGPTFPIVCICGQCRPGLCREPQSGGCYPCLPPTSCPGDCSGTGEVTVADIVSMVNLALYDVPPNCPVGCGGPHDPCNTCVAGDTRQDCQITIDEIIQAVNSALNGCPTVQTCGGIAGIACPSGEYCEFPQGMCAVADKTGECRPQTVCTPCDIPQFPVCGCDGHTYVNDCERAAAGVARDHVLGCLAHSRFVDNGDGTVFDVQTRRTWEQKTSTPGNAVDCSTTTCGDPHDVNNTYQWSATGTAPDGRAFTDFLARLNGALCSTSPCNGLGGRCDWRLPTVIEWQSIIDPNAPGCGSGSPCIYPAFSPTQANFYWSSSDGNSGPAFAATVDFKDGSTDDLLKTRTFFMRAVRGPNPFP